MIVDIALPFREDVVRIFANAKMSAAMPDRPATVGLNLAQRDRLILACKRWVADNPPPVKIEVEFTPAEVAAMRGAWVCGGTMPIGKARSKILDALPPEG